MGTQVRERSRQAHKLRGRADWVPAEGYGVIDHRVASRGRDPKASPLLHEVFFECFPRGEPLQVVKLTILRGTQCRMRPHRKAHVKSHVSVGVGSAFNRLYDGYGHAFRRRADQSVSSCRSRSNGILRLRNFGIPWGLVMSQT